MDTRLRTTLGPPRVAFAAAERARSVAERCARPVVALAVSVSVGSSAVLRPSLLTPVLGVGVLGALTFMSSTGLIVGLLTIRNVSDVFAGRTLAAGLNPGAMLGLLVIAVAVLRVFRTPRPRGVMLALSLSALALCWFFVGFVNFGGDQSLVRELVRVVSIVAMALIVLNASDIGKPSTVAGAVVLAGVIPAFVALVQLAQGKGFEGTNRVYGTLGHPNAASALFAVCLAITLWKLSEEGRSWRYILASLLFAIALVATAAMGGIARMLVTLIVYGLLAGRIGARGRRYVVIALLIVVGFSLSPLGRDRLAELKTTTSISQASQGDYTNSLDWRFMQWADLIKAWRDQPYFGYGLGATQELVTPNNLPPHSDPIRLLVEAGAIGSILFGALYVKFLRRLFACWRSGSADQRYPALVLAIIIGLTVHALADNIFDQTAAIYAAAVLVASVFADAARRSTQPQSA